MFIAHLGTGLAAKKVTPQVPLGVLLLAAQALDLIFPVLLLLGIEHVEIEPGNTVVTPLDFTYYPFSHSLFTTILIGVVFGAVYYLYKKEIKASVFLFLLVAGHWILDFISHIPDLPVFPWGSEFAGLGLWNSLWGTIIFESFIFAAGVYLYFKATDASNKTGKWAIIVFLSLIALLYIGNIVGPPPPSSSAIAYSGIGQGIIILLVYLFIDRNRSPVPGNN